MSTIIYGGDTLQDGLELSYVTTNLIDFSPVESDDGMEVMFTKATFDVAGVISKPLPPALIGENATQTLARVAHYFEQKRKAFQYAVNGQPLVTWNGGPDCRNGPHARGVRVTKVHGSECLHVQAVFELNICTCPNDTGQPWVAHRWTEDVTIDETARSTKTRRGKIVVRGDLRTSPDSLRGLVMPPIDDWFVREESQYKIEESGLAMQYTYRDREQYVMPPRPARKAEGTYIESTPQPSQRWGEVRVTLQGSTEDDKDVLMRLAIAVAWSKLKAEAFVGDKDMVIVGGAFQEDLYQPTVAVNFKARLKPLTRFRVGGVPSGDLSRFNQYPFGSDPDRDLITPQSPGTRGTAGLELVAQVLNDPCLSQVIIKSGGSLPSNTATLTAGAALLNALPDASVTFVRQLPTDFSDLHAGDPDPGIYENYRITIRTEQNYHKIQVPVGKAGAAPVIIQLAAPSQKRIVRWEAEKLGEPPRLPDPDIGTNYELAWSAITSDEVEPSGDGVNLRYTVTGVYKYFVKDFGQAVLYAGLPPWVDGQAKSEAVKAVSKFAKGIIDLGVPGSGAVFTAQGGIATQTGISTFP